MEMLIILKGPKLVYANFNYKESERYVILCQAPCRYIVYYNWSVALRHWCHCGQIEQRAKVLFEARWGIRELG